MFQPELREKAVTTCRGCMFLVTVIGRDESRTGCLAGIKEYGTLQKRVPREIHAMHLIRQTGKAGLLAVTSRVENPDQTACGLFRPRPAG